MIKNLVVKKDTNKQYHTSKSISASGLKSIFLTSVFDYNRKIYQDKPAYFLGSLIHEFFLEPEEFNKNYYCLDQKVDKRTKEGKAIYNGYLDQSEGRKLVSYEDHLILKGLETNLNDKSLPMSVLAKEYLVGEAELSHYLNYDGVDVRVRPDLLGDGFISDIKSASFNYTDGFGAKQFNSHVWNFAYNLQAVFYSDMLSIDPDNFKFIWMEKNYPFRIVVTTLNNKQINDGRKAYKYAINEWKHYLETGEENRFKDNDLLFDGSLLL